jgi:hypothetical protein
MTGPLDRWRGIAAGSGRARWLIGLLAVLVAAAVVWFALGPADDGRYAETGTPAASAPGDVVPPTEDDTSQGAVPGASGAATQDVIPPDEP